MSSRDSSARYDRSRDYDRDWERDRVPHSRRGSTYRPSEDSRDARRDDRRSSRDDVRDRRPQPPSRVDSSLSATAPGQVTPSVVSLASSPREPPEQTPVKQNSMSIRTENGLDNTNVDIYKGFLDTFNELAMANSKMENTSRVMIDCDQQQARLESGMPGTVMETKIWQDKKRRAKSDYDRAHKKQRDAEKLCTKNFQKLLKHLMDREKKATPVTSTFGQDWEASLLKKLQDNVKEQITTATVDQNKAMQDTLAKALADVAEAGEERQRQVREYLQKAESDIRDENSRNFQALEQTSAAQMDAMRKAMRQEMSLLKQHCDERVSALELQNQELRGSHQNIEKRLCEEQAEAICRLNSQYEELSAEQAQLKKKWSDVKVESLRSLDSQYQELRAEQEQLKKQLSENKVEYIEHLTSYKEELTALKQQVAATTTHPAAAEVQPLQSELSAVVANVASLSSRVGSMETSYKTATLESSQHQQEAIAKLEKRAGGLQDDVKDIFKALCNIQQRDGDRASLSAEPKSPRDSPAVDRQTQAHAATQATAGVTKKALKKSQDQQTLDIKNWTMTMLSAHEKGMEEIKQRIETLGAKIAPVQAQCSDLENKVQSISETTLKVSDEALYTQCREARDKVKDLEFKFDEERSHGRKRAEGWDQAISTLHDNQNSWRSTEMANWMIQQIQIHTPNMLAHAVQGIAGRVDNVEDRQSALERRVDQDPSANKRRKVTNGHMAVDNQQAVNHNNNQQMSTNPYTNVLVGWPSQSNGQRPNSQPASGHAQNQPVNGHQQSTPQYAHQNSPQVNGHLQNQPANGHQQSPSQYGHQQSQLQYAQQR